MGCPVSEPSPVENDELGGIYQKLRGSLLRYASRYFSKPQEIEDVVQEAFVKVLEAQAKRKIQATESYLYRTTKHLSLNVLNKSAYKLTDTVGDLLPESVLLETPSLEDQFESQQRFELFCRAVRQLPLKCQRAFILRRVYGFSQKEIAERMSISVKTVEVHLTKAIVRCTDYMDVEEEGVSARQASSAETPSCQLQAK